MSKMFYKFTSIISIIFLLSNISLLAKSEKSTNAVAANKHLAIMHTVQGDIEAKYNKFVEEKINAIGYKLTDPHKRVNDHYKEKYGSTTLEILGFMSIVNEKVVKPLFNIDPRIAGFNPFNMLIYKKIGEDAYHIGHLAPEAILDMLGITDKVVRKTYIKSFEPLDKMLSDEFGDNVTYLDYKKLADKRMMNFEVTFERPEDISDFVDEFQEKFEEAFEDKGYIIAGYNNFKESEGEDTIPQYDAFWTYSLCQFKYSYTVFDNEGSRPEAGLFAPCTMYMFIEKDTNKLVIGMPRLENWKATLEINDKQRSDYISKLDTEIPAILRELGASETENINPLTVKSSTVVKQTQKALKPEKELVITNKKLAHMYVLDGDIEDKYNKFVEETIKTIGFKLTDPHKRVNDHYKEKYGSTNLDILSFMSIVNENVVKPLFNIDPRIAGFNPFNLLIYKKLDENKTYVGHLTAKAILDMLGITDEKVRSTYSKSIDDLDTLIQKELGGKEVYMNAKEFAKDRMMNFAITFDQGQDLDDVVDDFQEKFEEAFEDKDYIIAGFNNFKESDGEDTIPDFDAFWTYSLCHFKYSYTVFDNEGSRPEGGLFAPCTMYLYIKKGTNQIIVGMPKLENWRSTLGIHDKVRSDFIGKLDAEIPSIMKKLGAIEIENKNPLMHIVPKVKTTTDKAQAVKPVASQETVKQNVISKPSPLQKITAPTIKLQQPTNAHKKAEPTQTTAHEPIAAKPNDYKIVLPTPPKPVDALNVVTVGGSNITYEPSKKEAQEHSIVFSKRVPPSTSEDMPKVENTPSNLIGDVNQNRVSVCLRGAFMDVDTVKQKLEAGGFQVVATTPIDKKGTLTTIIFTDENLLDLAKKKNAGFIASLRVLVDSKDKTISITNPIYFTKAFIEDGFDMAISQKILGKIHAIFKELKASSDQLKFTLLPKYHFMVGMPYYKDMIEIAKAATSAALLMKLKNKDGGKHLVFTQKINANTYLVGVKLNKRTSKFIKKTGRNNAGLLPYPILIENGVAKILDPKYYISVSYPMLKMSNFMKIATVPGAIQKDCENLFH